MKFTNSLASFLIFSSISAEAFSEEFCFKVDCSIVETDWSSIYGDEAYTDGYSTSGGSIAMALSSQVYGLIGTAVGGSSGASSAVTISGGEGLASETLAAIRDIVTHMTEVQAKGSAWVKVKTGDTEVEFKIEFEFGRATIVSRK